MFCETSFLFIMPQLDINLGNINQLKCLKIPNFSENSSYISVMLWQNQIYPRKLRLRKMKNSSINTSKESCTYPDFHKISSISENISHTWEDSLKWTVWLCLSVFWTYLILTDLLTDLTKCKEKFRMLQINELILLCHLINQSLFMHL